MKIIDYIVTENNKRIAMVELEQENDYTYSGLILKDDFPINLKHHIENYHKMVDEGVFGVLDDIEKEIYKYGLMLENEKKHLHHILIEGKNISFYTKYPTGKGFINDWPLR